MAGSKPFIFGFRRDKYTISHFPLDAISGISRNTAILIADFTAYPGRIIPSTNAMIRQHSKVTAITAPALRFFMECPSIHCV
jgi:hypothetical protein